MSLYTKIYSSTEFCPHFEVLVWFTVSTDLTLGGLIFAQILEIVKKKLRSGLSGNPTHPPGPGASPRTPVVTGATYGGVCVFVWEEVVVTTTQGTHTPKKSYTPASCFSFTYYRPHTFINIIKFVKWCQYIWGLLDTCF